MMGGALGGIEAMFLPNEGAGFWPLVGMGAILGGTMRSPLTGIVFALELTHDINVLLPLLVASVIAHLFTVLVLKRSILTEKVARRGYHLSREYAVDPLEILFARDAMRTNLVAFRSDSTLEEVRAVLSTNHGPRGQHLYPVVDQSERLRGVITRNDLRKWLEDPHPAGEMLRDVVKDPIVAHPDEPLRVVVYRMAETGLTRFPVVERGDERKLLGVIGLQDLLSARTRNLSEERDRERVLRIRMPSLSAANRSAVHLPGR
jgi:chloride channel protein, CIC family